MSEVRNLRSNYGKKNYGPGWIPFAGSKRKAPMDDVASDYEVQAPPTKQFAIDDEVANDISKDGYLMTDSRLEPERVPEVEMDDEPEEETSGISYSGMDNMDTNASRVKDSGGVGFDGLACMETGHAAPGVNYLKSAGANDRVGSVVLSEELLATLARRPNDVSVLRELPIPPSIVQEEQSKNAMAMVLWKPQSEILNVRTEAATEDEQEEKDTRTTCTTVDDRTFDLPPIPIDDHFDEAGLTSNIYDVEMEDSEL